MLASIAYCFNLAKNKKYRFLLPFVKIPYFQLRSPSISIGLISKSVFLLGSLALGQWAMSDLFHLEGGVLGLVLCLGGIWWISKPLVARFNAPQTVQGWIRQCQKVLEQFEILDDQEKNKLKYEERKSTLQEIIDREEPQKIAFVCSNGVELPNKDLVQTAISCSYPISLSWSSSLPLKDNSWNWPKTLFEQDLLVYVLPLPLRASDLLWLGHIPEDQPSWIMVSTPDSLNDWSDQLKALQAQLPHRWSDCILRWSNHKKDLAKLLSPVRRTLDKPQKNIDLTRQRLLSRLHSSWQADLETLRRNKFRAVQNRTQWVVAGAVFASPVPTTDLLALSVANGLMIQEMADIWSCSWKPETLQLIAKQLAAAAIAQGVVEWSGHALLGFAKLHGGSWFAAGTIQAISAAYLTRVVGRSMADWMALNNGVSEPDLQVLKQKLPQLVANAAEKERMDWGAFLNQANKWIKERRIEPQLQTTYVNPV